MFLFNPIESHKLELLCMDSTNSGLESVNADHGFNRSSQCPASLVLVRRLEVPVNFSGRKNQKYEKGAEAHRLSLKFSRWRSFRPKR